MRKNLNYTFKYLTITVLLAVNSFSAWSQVDSLNRMVDLFQQYGREALPEKIYVHTDRTLYLTGETLWYKMYYLDGISHQPLDLSKVAYLEIVDQDQKPVLQAKTGLDQGTSDGSLFLPASINSGSYMLRAYTAWMKNFDASFFFQTPITIVNSFKTLGLQQPLDTLGYEVDFFPEGGNLVAGLKSKVGFKVVARSGKGADVRGFLMNQSGDTLLTYRPLKMGIGHFYFTPQPEQTYFSLVRDEDGQVSRHELPQVYQQGYVMHVKDSTDLLHIQVRTTFQDYEPLYFLAHSRQVIKKAEVKMTRQGVVNFDLDPDILAEGISHFTLFNAQKEPLCERLYFKYPEQKLSVQVNTSKDHFQNREKVTLEIQSKLEDLPVNANLSLSVFRQDQLPDPDFVNLYAYIWLASDLAGKIEQPSYYFSQNNPLAGIALDNLLLTQGWRRFDWSEVWQGKQQTFQYIPEVNGHIIRGQVRTIASNRPKADVLTYLASPGKYVRLYGSKSDRQGNIMFEMQDFYGSNEIIVQSNIMRDSTVRVSIHSPFSDQPVNRAFEPFNIHESLTEDLVSRSISMQVQNAYYEKELKKYILPVVDSTAFYGAPDQQFYLDEFTRFPTMEDVMREYVAGVWLRKRKQDYYFIVYDELNKSVFNNESLVLLDGVPVFDINKIIDYDPLKVERIDVVKKRYFHGPITCNGLVSYITYGGNMEGFQLDPRSLLLDYDGLEIKREYYSPDYGQNESSSPRKPDFRNLLHWEPEIITGSTGRAAIEFFTSDQAGSYKIVVQGMTPEGKIGYAEADLTVDQALNP